MALTDEQLREMGFADAEIGHIRGWSDEQIARRDHWRRADRDDRGPASRLLSVDERDGTRSLAPYYHTHGGGTPQPDDPAGQGFVNQTPPPPNPYIYRDGDNNPNSGDPHPDNLHGDGFMRDVTLHEQREIDEVERVDELREHDRGQPRCSGRSCRFRRGSGRRQVVHGIRRRWPCSRARVRRRRRRRHRGHGRTRRGARRHPHSRRGGSMSQGPLSNPVPSSGTNAYPEHGPDGGPPATRVADGTAIKEVVSNHPRAHSPAPVLRDGQGRIVPGSGRRQS